MRIAGAREHIFLSYEDRVENNRELILEKTKKVCKDRSWQKLVAVME
ncbi:MAG: hypothetical protein V1749_07395 [Candidatus Desantisbacteria bacterium]